MANIESGTESGGNSADPAVPEGYEPPRMVPFGNLHDLLAGGGATQCDEDFQAGFQQPGQC